MIEAGVDEDFESLPEPPPVRRSHRRLPDNERGVGRPTGPRVAVPNTIYLDFDRGQWTDLTIDALRVLWHLEFSSAAIGDYLGFTKNAIVGKARRLDLLGRESPIIRDGRPRRAARQRIPAVTLPALRSDIVATPMALKVTPSIPRLKPTFVDFRSSLPRPDPKPKFVSDDGYTLGPSQQPCQWVVRPGSVVVPWVQCGVTRAAWPYCSKHMKRAYGRQAASEAA